MREYSRAQKAYEDAMTIDPNNQEAIDGFTNCIRSNDEDPEKARERALQDPEVQEVWNFFWKFGLLRGPTRPRAQEGWQKGLGFFIVGIVS